jgi:hypothetical protein
MADKKSMRVDAAAVTDVVVDAAKKQAWAIASRIAKAGGHTPEEIVTIAKSAAAATEQTLVRVAKSAASASAASGSGRAPPTKRRKSANRSGGDLNSQEQSASRHASATSDAASGGGRFLQSCGPCGKLVTQNLCCGLGVPVGTKKTYIGYFIPFHEKSKSIHEAPMTSLFFRQRPWQPQKRSHILFDVLHRL